MNATFEIFLQTAPGLEEVLRQEALETGFADPVTTPGGVSFQGGWPEVWKANLHLRGAGRVLARIGSFPAVHLAQLDKRARKFDWASVFAPELPVKVDVTTKKSKIYHAGAARQRIEGALSAAGIPLAEDGLTLKVRIEDNIVTFSVDTSGEALHKRGHKPAVGKAPMRETLAAMFLRQMGYRGDVPVLDPMCGSGTFVLEAAEIACGLAPGRDRSFAFEQFRSFDAGAWAEMRAAARGRAPERLPAFRGSDRDDGAIRNARQNAEAAGLGDIVHFERHGVSELQRPEGPAGLVIVNPPYGARIGNRKLLFSLYGALGKTLSERFRGWQVGIVTSDAGLAKATALPFLPSGASVAHGGLSVTLFRTAPLP
ncbi:class I SAM-dependent RNA methyltransferase [Pseudooceanicola sp. CBS1P-1]|uniref:Class I SAM-dependent RNA methyltransferase n=1 Tax=Pseudooceanicola albus TaxID=2692189 RepID=A0A6L7G0D9_9RHOB|nr:MULTISPECIES: class I SAM-dependent RNA methyltransferase [Pseudooceanicola]MBT9383691.1 class I SAM-dependent RNA methyltransferase [Pseudooceanicola endophyticus]MXN17545.1 class I SAM-dependent RNA methyltransferase [Pseudooceanicola albus]